MLITLEGAIIFNFQVEYQVFSTGLFNKVFYQHIKPTKKITYNPYRNITALDTLSVVNDTLTAHLPSVAPENCAGHFENAPMLPVGIFAYIAIDAIGYFLVKITGNADIQYYLHSADMDVLSPIPIVGTGEIKIRYHGDNDDYHRFSWSTLHDDYGLLNTMQLSFTSKL